MTRRNKERVIVALVLTLAAVLLLLAFEVLWPVTHYADGGLIDATGGIVLEEDGDPSELGVRIIMLASGAGRFTDEQLAQIKELFAGLCESVRDNAMRSEMLEQKVERLQEALQQKEGR